MNEAKILIIGAGMAGLACAARLAEAGLRPAVLEASDGVGGRVRTDEVHGFRLDRGFQVLLTAYPEARRVFDYDALDLRRFEPGALVFAGGSFHRVSDPWRRPGHAFATLRADVGTVADKLRIAKLRRRAKAGTLEDVFARDQQATVRYLRDAGVSARMVERFFRPFLGGVFLERNLETSSRIFDFVFRMFAQGDTTVPARGMGELPAQLAARLPVDTLRLSTRVAELNDDGVTLESGERLRADAVVVATDAHESARLRGSHAGPDGGSVSCLYFAASEPPMREPVLMLDGDGMGPVNNVVVPSQVSPDYAPEGRALVSVSVVGEPPSDERALETDVRTQLTSWFGDPVSEWEHLRTYAIRRALPLQTPAALESLPRDPRVGARRYICGDHCENGSLNGALASGRRAAEAVIDDM